MTPLTITFGAWAPDLANVAMEVPPIAGPVTVPLSDALNVYYQDGAYRSLPGPASIGPALGAQALNAFTWYDYTGGQEIVFAATASGISSLIDGAWASVPVVNAVSVFVSGFKLTLTLAGLTVIQGLQANFTLGSITVSGQLFTGTLTSVQLNAFQWGFISGAGGSLTPASDLNGNTITEMILSPTANGFTLRFGTPSLGATYFTSITFTSLSVTLLASSATYSTDGSTESNWTWTGGTIPSGIQTPGNYPVTIQ